MSRDQDRRYTSPRETATRHEQEQQSTRLKIPKGVSFFQLKKEGVRRINIIPYIVGDGNPMADKGMVHWERTYYMHRNIGPNEESVVCPAKTFKKPCPICEHLAKISRDPDTPKEDKKALKPKQRQLFNIIDDENREDGILIWDIAPYLFGDSLFKKLKDADPDEVERYDQFFRLGKKGSVLKLSVVESSFEGNTFCSVDGIEFKERKEGLDEDLLDKAYCLDDMVVEIPYDKLDKLFRGEIAGVDDDDDRPKREEKKERRRDDDDDDRPAKARDKEDDKPKRWDDDDEPPPKKKEEEKKKSPLDDDDDDRPKKDEKKDEPKKDKPKDDPTAEDMGIKVGTKVRHKRYGKCVVISVSGDGTSLKLEDEDDEVYRAIAPGDCEVLKSDKEGKDKKEDD